MENKTQHYDIQLKSPMGWIKILADITFTAEGSFEGEAKLMGLTVPMTDCVREGEKLRFHVAPRLPFGVLDVDIDAALASDGTVTGVANAPRHRPMELKGSRIG